MHYFENSMVRLSLILLASIALFSCNKPSCDDGKLNQDEVKIDCGGASCGPCPSCFDGIQNQDETDIDCGGVCGACPPEWIEISSPVSTSLNGSVWLGDDQALIVGDGGVILKSSDRGLTWSNKTSGTTMNLNALFEIDGLIYACGDETLLKSTNNGETWIAVEDGGSGKQWYTLWFHSADEGMLGGDFMTINKTDDGGDNWDVKHSTGLESTPIKSIHFFNEQSGYFCESDRLHSTFNGGNDWQSHSTSQTFGKISDLHFLTTSRGFMVAADGIWVTQNYVEWLNKGFRISTGDIDFYEETGLYAGQYLDSSRGAIYLSEDNGVLWVEQTIPGTPTEFNAALMIDEQEGFAITNSGQIFYRQRRE